MLDKQSYSRWDKLPRSVKTNKPIEENEGGRGSAGSMFDQARSNQGIEQMQVFTRAMNGVCRPSYRTCKNIRFFKL